jgi:hypothetical protein
MPSTYTDPALAVNLGFSGMGSRNNDQIQYWSPTMSGVQLRLSTQLAGDTSNASTPATKTNEFGLSYAAGPLSVNLTGANVTATDNSKTSPMGIYGAYNFGAFAAHLGYVDKDNIAGDKILGDKVAGDKILGDNIQTQINNNPDLAQAARDIKALLNELSDEYNPATEKGQAKIQTSALTQIKQNPQLKQRTLKALKSAGEEALEQAISHPVAKVVVQGIKGFIEG